MKTKYPNCETHYITCECQWKPQASSVGVSKISTNSRRNTTFVTTTSYNLMVAFIVAVSIFLTEWQRPVTLIDAFMIIGHYHNHYHHHHHRSKVNNIWTATDIVAGQRRYTMMLPFPKQRLAISSQTQQMAVKVYNNVATKPPEAAEAMERNENDEVPTSNHSRTSSEQVKLRMDKQLERLKLKDRLSPKLSREELDIVYEDDHLMIVNKPAGLLTVAGKDKSNNSLVQAVYEHCQSGHNIQFQQADHMVVHRLGMDVSGLLILAKNADTMRKLNTHFRTRQMERTYEALVCGHVIKNKGRITLPLMRDYEHPLYMRVSTDQHQEALIDLDPDVVGKKLLEQPKDCITEYKVLSREELNGEPVTRLLLRSVSGRMHQLNCHLAAIGHPIVGDLSYGGINGMAAPNGGLSDDELDYMIPKVFSLQSNNRVTMEQQLRTTAGSSSGSHEIIANVTCHAKTIRFRHPITKKYVTFDADAPF